jgi:DNA-binding CsgD family transcriptional regulator
VGFGAKPQGFSGNIDLRDYGSINSREHTHLQLLKRVQGAIAGYNMTDPEIIAMFTRQNEKMPRLGFREFELVDLSLTNPFATNVDLAARMNTTPGHVGKMFHKLYIKFQVHKRAELLAELRKFGYRAKSGDDAGKELLKPSKGKRNV